MGKDQRNSLFVIGVLYHGGGGDVAEAKIRKCDYLTMVVL